MNKVRLFFIALAVIMMSFTVFNSCDQAPKEGGEQTQEEMWQHMKKEAMRSDHDYACYIPRSYDYSTHDSHNEHFLVFENPGDSLMAIWTQAVGRGEHGHRNRIVFSRSSNNGSEWSEPKHLVGPKTFEDSTHIASWAFPMVTNKGRIYVLWNQNIGKSGWIYFHTGIMKGMYSDDNGKTWSEPQRIPLKHSPYYDDPDKQIPPEWIVWQNPMRDLRGNYFVGYTHWVKPEHAYFSSVDKWTAIESVCEFMRFTNIEDHPEPRNIDIRYLGWGDNALKVPHFKHPNLSIAQEPSIVRLPDERLFCVMRTNTGYIWYSVSDDDGKSWSNPQPLLRKDHGQPILQPVSPCPIYQLADGRYILLHHNNEWNREEMPANPRRPAYIALGEYRPDAQQPIWFSRSKVFLDNGGINVKGEKDKNAQIATYTSFTRQNGKNILWYPDRKCFLLGKEVTKGFLEDLEVPVTK